MTAPSPEVVAGRVWRQRTGSGPRVAVVHGVMDRASSFGRIARHLTDVELIRYDRRGYGHSQVLGPATDVETQVADLVDVLDGAPAVVFGHSYGGTLALAAAARRPDLVRAVVAYEFPMAWTTWWPENSAGASALAAAAGSHEEAAERFMRRMIGDDRWAKLPPSTKQARRAEGAAMAADLEQVRPPHPPAFDPAVVGVPVIAAHGTLGAAHHARSAAAFVEVAPRARLVEVEGAGHGVHLSHPAVVADLVRSLLDG